MDPDWAQINRVTGRILDAVFDVHSELGPGLLESIYARALGKELTTRGLRWEREVRIPVAYKGEVLGSGLRLDLLVEDLVIVELKVAEAILPVHEAQLLSYLRLARRPVGLLLNFNTARLRDGILRRVL